MFPTEAKTRSESVDPKRPTDSQHRVTAVSMPFAVCRTQIGLEAAQGHGTKQRCVILMDGGLGVEYGLIADPGHGTANICKHPPTGQQVRF